MSMAVLLGLGAAVGYGIGDFLAGYYSRRFGIRAVLAIGQLAGLVVLLAAALWFSPPPTGPADLAWGALAGTVGVIGGYLLLQGFRTGQLSVVSPVSSLGAAGLPLLVDLIVYGIPSIPVLAGVSVGLVAIWLISTPSSATEHGGRGVAAGFWYGLGAGIGFAGMFLALDFADPNSGAWPAVTAQAAVALIALILALGRPQELRLPANAWPGIVLSGIAGALATASFVFAARAGLVSIAAVIASLSPAVTVLLAGCVLHERLPPRQITGLVVAGVALVLIGLD